MVDEAYNDRTEWIKKSIRTTAKVWIIIFNNNCNKGERQIIHNLEQMGKFSSDRAIQDYAQEYWNIESTKVK